MQQTHSGKYNIIFLLFVMPFLIGTGIDLYVPSLPAIAGYFSVPSHLVQLTIAFYMLSYGVGQVILGILSDSVGRKKVLLASSFLYTCVSFAAVFSPNIYVLLLCRFVQGFFIAGLGVLSRAIASDCFSGIELTKAITFVATSFALGPIIGPFIGGYLQHYFNWQANFYFFAIYGLFIFLYIVFAIPETGIYRHTFKIKKIYNSIMSIITNPLFICIAILANLTYGSLVIFNVIGPFLIQTVLKYSVVVYGHIALLLGVGYFVGNMVNRHILNYINSSKITLFALIGALCVNVIALYFSVFFESRLLYVLLPTLLLFFFCGLIFPNMMAKCTSLFPKIAGTASAIFGAFLGGVVFLMTSFASILKTNTQKPLVITYIIIFMLCFILFFVCKKIGCYKQN